MLNGFRCTLFFVSRVFVSERFLCIGENGERRTGRASHGPLHFLNSHDDVLGGSDSDKPTIEALWILAVFVRVASAMGVLASFGTVHDYTCHEDWWSLIKFVRQGLPASACKHALSRQTTCPRGSTG